MAVQIEDVLLVVKELVRDEHFAELTDFLPEQGVVPVFDEEVVVFDVRIDRACELDQAVECLAVIFRGKKLTVFLGHAGARLDDFVERATDVFATAQCLDVAAQGGEGQAGSVIQTASECV